jgi:hypothetical protein
MTGSLQCRNGTTACVPLNRPEPETCNGLDDDCDGMVDNNCATTTLLCSRNPLWVAVNCSLDPTTTLQYYWSNNHSISDPDQASAAGALFVGCQHHGIGPCSFNQTGWVSIESMPLRKCSERWQHIGMPGTAFTDLFGPTLACREHDAGSMFDAGATANNGKCALQPAQDNGDQVWRLALRDTDCYAYDR